MGWAGLDQRAFPRIDARCDIWIGDQIGEIVKTKTQNLGAGGICVISEREFEKLTRVHLRLTLKEGAPPVECDGRVVWMVRSKELVPRKVSFDIGVEFLDLKAPDRDVISNFIDKRRLALGDGV